MEPLYIPNTAKQIVAVAFSVATLFATGCQQGWEPNYSKLGLVEISGKVTMDGRPTPNVTVIFEAEDKTYSFGKTDDSGKYRMMFDSEKSGVLPGPKIIRIRSGAGEGEDEGPRERDGKKAGKSVDVIPTCYSSKSQIKLTVDKSRTYDFSLKSDCSVQGPD